MWDNIVELGKGITYKTSMGVWCGWDSGVTGYKAQMHVSQVSDAQLWQVLLFKISLLKDIWFSSCWSHVFARNPVLMATGQKSVFLPYLKPDIFQLCFAHMFCNYKLAADMKLPLDNLILTLVLPKHVVIIKKPVIYLCIYYSFSLQSIPAPLWHPSDALLCYSVWQRSCHAETTRQ